MEDVVKTTEQEILEKGAKSYAIGTISIDHLGVWHIHYVGGYLFNDKQHFGNHTESGNNIRKLADKVASNLNRFSDVYLSQIAELRAAEVTEQLCPQVSDLST